MSLFSVQLFLSKRGILQYNMCIATRSFELCELGTIATAHAIGLLSLALGVTWQNCISN